MGGWRVEGLLRVGVGHMRCLMEVRRAVGERERERIVNCIAIKDCFVCGWVTINHKAKEIFSVSIEIAPLPLPPSRETGEMA